MNKYFNNDINNPIFLFHGSPKQLETIEQRLAHDSNGNKENEDFAVFMTSSFIIASAYAFKDKIKENFNSSLLIVIVLIIVLIYNKI